MIEVSVYYPVVKEIGKVGKDKVRVEFVMPKRPFLVWKTWEPGFLTQFPKGYGRVYLDWLRREELLAPMPFNVVIGLIIWLYRWTRYGAAYWFGEHWVKKIRRDKW